MVPEVNFFPSACRTCALFSPTAAINHAGRSRSVVNQIESIYLRYCCCCFSARPQLHTSTVFCAGIRHGIEWKNVFIMMTVNPSRPNKKSMKNVALRVHTKCADFHRLVFSSFTSSLFVAWFLRNSLWTPKLRSVWIMFPWIAILRKCFTTSHCRHVREEIYSVSFRIIGQFVCVPNTVIWLRFRWMVYFNLSWVQLLTVLFSKYMASDILNFQCAFAPQMSKTTVSENQFS